MTSPRTGARNLKPTQHLLGVLLAISACSEPRFKGMPEDDGGGGQHDGGTERDGGDGGHMPAFDGSTWSDSATDGAPASDASGVDVDAGANEQDAQVQPPSEIPSWAPTLDGQYAVRVVTFADDMDVVARARVIQLATISHQGDAYELRLQPCHWVADAVVGDLQASEPASLVPFRQRLRFDGESFSTEPVDTAMGFDAIAPECADKPGEEIPKRPYQSWITGANCRCPGPALPDTINDCRITDPEGDGKPGYTVHFFANTFPLIDADVYVVSTYHTAFVNAARNDDGSLSSQVKPNETTQQLGCSLGNNPDNCLQFTGTAASCPPAYNAAEFTPLATRTTPSGGWTCEAIVARLGELFPGPEPTPPTGCDL